jgi:predicted RNA-binding Zn-ribbon protein involved in translation (DUF1610 family)
MTEAVDLIKAAAGLGVELLLSDSGQIQLSGPETSQARELVERIRSRRDDVVWLLQQRQSWPASRSYDEPGDDNARMERYARLCRWGAEVESSTTMTDERYKAAFPACPKCGAYCLHRERNVGPYECQRCGLMGILEADARNAGAQKNQLRQEAHA